MKSPITTHVLDTSQGRPAVGVPAVLEVREASEAWRELAHGVTDDAESIDAVEQESQTGNDYGLTAQQKDANCAIFIRSHHTCSIRGPIPIAHSM